MIGGCVRCQREGGAKSRADVLHYGLALCYSHELQLRSDLDSLGRIGTDDPEAAHGRADEVLLKWAPASIAEAVSDLAKRQPWWATS